MTTKQYKQVVLGLIVSMLVIWVFAEWYDSYRKKGVESQPLTITTTITIDVRAYCPDSCCVQNPEWCDGKFANNEVAKGLAIASNTLPIGTVVYVPEYGFAKVKDRGPNLIEVFFEKHKDAVNWGVKRNVRVKVLGR